jgi:pyruvate carboxylase
MTVRVGRQFGPEQLRRSEDYRITGGEKVTVDAMEIMLGNVVTTYFAEWLDDKDCPGCWKEWP